MKTKEFIKMLQEADPSGESHIRMSGGIPVFAELKAGYWDGPYSYIDEEGNYVYSTKGNKVDIYCRDIESFIEINFNLHDNNKWEDIEKLFKFELGYGNDKIRKEREDSILKMAKEEWQDTFDIYNDMFQTNRKRAVENTEKGWTWFQNKLVDDDSIKPNQHHYYTWLIYDETGKEEFSNMLNTEPVYKSGDFERLDNNKKPGYYEWILK